MEPMFILFLICLIIHLLAMFYDLQTGEVPLVLSSIYFIAGMMYALNYNMQKIEECLIAASIISIILIGFVIKANLGGADTIFLAVSAMFYGYVALYEVVIAFALSIPYAVYMKIKNNEHDYPFMPYITVANMITFFLYFNFKI